jgi:hypothetical protein
MTRGKHSQSVNNRLRHDLDDAARQIRHLEQQLHDTTRRLEAAEAWRANVDADAHPAIAAERLRADLAVAEAEEARTAEREHWLDLVERTRPIVTRILKQYPRDCSLGKVREVADLAEIYGDAIGECLPGANRTMRRNTRTRGQFLSAVARTQQLDQMTAAGHAPQKRSKSA